MKTGFRFQKLEVWQQGRNLNARIYQLTRQFPAHELYGMTSQIRRASVSISSNIAEGSGRNSDKDFAHFLEQAYGSLMETASLLYLALDQKYLSDNEVNSTLAEMEVLAGKLVSLNRSLAVIGTKTPFARPSRNPALDPRPSTLD